MTLVIPQLWGGAQDSIVSSWILVLKLSVKVNYGGDKPTQIDLSWNVLIQRSFSTWGNVKQIKCMYLILTIFQIQSCKTLIKF